MPLDTHPQAKREIHSVVGTRPLRPDGVDKVTGRAKFGADATAPGMLVGLVLRSPARPCPHQEDRHLEGRKAGRREGGHHQRRFPRSAPTAIARMLRHARELHGAREGALRRPRGCRRRRRRRRASARKALKLIKVDYEVLPHVTDVDEAMKPGRAGAARRHLHRRRRAQADEAVEHREALRVRPWRRRGRLQAGRRHRRAQLQDRADAPGLYRAPCLPRQRRPRRPGRAVGLHPGPFRGPQHLRARCSAWTSPSCASPPRRSAAASAARPRSSSSRWRSRCRARPTAR